MDPLGRLSLPLELCKSMGWLPQDAKSGRLPRISVEMFATEKGLFLRPHAPDEPAPTDTTIESVEM